MDISALQHLSETLPRATVGFELLRNGAKLFDGRVTVYRDERPRGSDWLDVGESGVEVQPGDEITLQTFAFDAEGQEIEPSVAVYAGFGGLRLERTRAALRTHSSARQPNVVLVVMDTLRMDRLSAYGYERATSPVLDGMADRGTLFENAYGTASWTWHSTASILTGLLPQEHGVVRGGSCYLSQEVLTLAEALQEQGFTTAA